MSTFAFRAIDVAGVAAQGELEAASKMQVTEQLRQRGLIVLDVAEKREGMKIESIFQRFKSVNLRNLSVFSRQFATLIASGMPMLRSLYTLEEQTEDEMLQKAIVSVATGRRGGQLGRVGDGVPARGLRPAVSLDGLRRRGLGPARAVARPGRPPPREGRRAASPGEVGDDVPGGRLRARRWW